MKKKLLAELATVVFIIGMCGVANALTITNGGFETGDASGWTDPLNGWTPGSVEQFHDGFGPTEGSYFARLWGGLHSRKTYPGLRVILYRLIGILILMIGCHGTTSLFSKLMIIQAGTTTSHMKPLPM